MRNHSSRIQLADLPAEVMGTERRTITATLDKPVVHSRANELYDRMTLGGESFWAAVHPLFMARDMTRDDLRAIITQGLSQTRGSYRLVLQLFNMPPEDYKAFLSFLRKHQCHMPFFRFRCLPVPVERSAPGPAAAAGSAVGAVAPPLSKRA